MFDPLELAKITKGIVCEDDKRKYYRFRKAYFYGGIATADCVGCNLRCIYCWAWNVVNKPNRIGDFYYPEEVAEKLVSIAETNGFNKLRISGNEPTLCKEHLLSILEKIPKKFLFILETNGILIGYDESYAKDLSKFKNIHVRVSLKGSNDKEFSQLTGAKQEFFQYQLKALKNLIENGVSCHPAIIEIAKNIENVRNMLGEIDNDLKNSLEIEPLIKYPAVMERMKRFM
jgi:uncharacterized Fe-S cluster-containing radical SAM superfamily protein